MAGTTVEKILKDVAAGKVRPVYLGSGDAVLAEPPAQRLAAALAERVGCEVEVHRRPADLGALLQDLRTYSLFSSGKVILAVDSALFADEKAAAELVDQAEEALPVDDPAAELSRRQRAGASRLLQALQVFGLDTRSKSPTAAVVDSLPKWAFQGGRAYRKGRPRGRTAKQVEALKEGLADLLEAARKNELQGYAEGDLAELGTIVQQGLPDGHALVLVEHAVAASHPVVKTLRDQGAAFDAGRVTAVRGEWQGVESLAAELARETSATLAPDALAELARRTLRQSGDWSRKQVDAESTARFAAEYRKLAALAGGGQITRRQVEEAVEDRGEEDVWQILDALGNGRGGEALGRLRRLLAAADDAYGERLKFFGLLATFCRQLVAVAGMAKIQGVPPGVRNYQQFKNRWAPALQAELPEGGKNPIAGLHPFRLHRAYLAASSFDRAEIPHLPWWVLEAEMQLKGESSEPDAALAQLMARIAAAVGKSGGRPRPGR
jgi:DNA polymerase-3 subunit delta